jgi:hypothetical protein
VSLRWSSRRYSRQRCAFIFSFGQHSRMIFCISAMHICPWRGSRAGCASWWSRVGGSHPVTDDAFPAGSLAVHANCGCQSAMECSY